MAGDAEGQSHQKLHAPVQRPPTGRDLIGPELHPEEQGICAPRWAPQP